MVGRDGVGSGFMASSNYTVTTGYADRRLRPEVLPTDRSHNPWRETIRRAQCGKSARCDRGGGGWKRRYGRIEAPANGESRRQRLLPRPKATAPALDPTTGSSRASWRSRRSRRRSLWRWGRRGCCRSSSTSSIIHAQRSFDSSALSFSRTRT